jgi:hypothetical protein
MVIRYGSHLIDTSVKTRLERLQRRLSGSEIAANDTVQNQVA